MLIMMVNYYRAVCKRDAGPQEVDCEIPYWLEKGTKHSLVWKPVRNICVLKP